MEDRKMEGADGVRGEGAEGVLPEDRGLRGRLSNFWYYYKWHTLVAIFVLAVIIIGVTQCSTRVDFDGYVLYAGPHELERSSIGGDTPAYNKLLSELKRLSYDRDGDGIVNIDLRNLFVVNDEEADELIGDNKDLEINEALVSEDTQTLGTVMLFSEYYLCFLSERLFLEYDGKYEGALFADLSPYLKEGNSYEFAGGNTRGVYLRSISEFYSLPEASRLPADTVVCLRALSEVSSTFNKGDNEKYFAWGEEMLKKLLACE